MKKIFILLLVIASLNVKSQIINNPVLKFSVEVTDTVNFPPFRPDALFIISWQDIPPVNGTAMIRVKTRLEQKKPNEETIRTSTDDVPRIPFAAIIEGRDKITGAITGINVSAFNLLLTEFKLRVKQ